MNNPMTAASARHDDRQCAKKRRPTVRPEMDVILAGLDESLPFCADSAIFEWTVSPVTIRDLAAAAPSRRGRSPVRGPPGPAPPLLRDLLAHRLGGA